MATELTDDGIGTSTSSNLGDRSGNPTGSSLSGASDSTESESSSNTLSLLAKLCCPKPSDLARKRKVASNPPPVGKRRARGHGTFDPKSVTPSQRVKEFPDECLTVSNKQLFCTACREELSTKCSIINNHVSSTKQKAGKQRLENKQRVERDIADSFQSSDKNLHVVETLPKDQQVYRVRVVTAFSRAAVPFTKLDVFRPLLEENSFRLSDRRHMSDLIRFCYPKSKDILKMRLQGDPFLLFLMAPLTLEKLWPFLFALWTLHFRYNSGWLGCSYLQRACQVRR